MKKLILVTINYNSEKETLDLLESLEKIERKNFSLQIIIVDNGSKKQFQLNQKNFKNPVEILYSEKNLGFAGGNNIGIKEALRQNADYILLINNDTKVYSDMIKKLINAIESDLRIGITTPKIYFAKGHEFHKSRYKPEELGKVIWYAGGSTDWNNVISIHHGVDQVDRGQFNKADFTDFATGCCMLIKKEVFEKIGFFNEKYFLYYEDADLNERTKRAGYRIYFAPQAMLIHKNASSSGGPGNKLHDYFLTRNQMLFGLTYAPLKTKISLIRQSIRLLLFGRKYQKKAILDFYLNNFGPGSFF